MEGQGQTEGGHGRGSKYDDPLVNPDTERTNVVAFE